MTPAQVAHIMARVDEHARASAELSSDVTDRGYVSPALQREKDATRAAVEAALRDAPQAEGWVMVPVDVLKAASESLGSFVSDHGWGDADMQAMDNLDAYLAARPSAPTAVEPRDERCDFELWMNTQPESASGKWWCRQLDDGGYSCHESDVMWRAWQARASKGTK